eukprot:Gb_39917 [translate_table: standard]
MVGMPSMSIMKSATSGSGFVEACHIIESKRSAGNMASSPNNADKECWGAIPIQPPPVAPLHHILSLSSVGMGYAQEKSVVRNPFVLLGSPFLPLVELGSYHGQEKGTLPLT